MDDIDTMDASAEELMAMKAGMVRRGDLVVPRRGFEAYVEEIPPDADLTWMAYNSLRYRGIVAILLERGGVPVTITHEEAAAAANRLDEILDDDETILRLPRAR